MVKWVWEFWGKLPGGLRYVAPAMAGVTLGLLLAVAHISNAASYMSDNPEACINCHIMTPQYASWQHSSHREVAHCNDCHVPHTSMAAKYYFKAKDGFRHSAIFTLRREPHVIQAIPESKEVIQQNCIRCHGQVMQTVAIPHHADFERSCVDCHREVPHGRVNSLSATPNAAVPPLTPITPDWLGGNKGKE